MVIYMLLLLLVEYTDLAIHIFIFLVYLRFIIYFSFFFNDTAPPEIYTTDTPFPYTTLFRSVDPIGRPARPYPADAPRRGRLPRPRVGRAGAPDRALAVRRAAAPPLARRHRRPAARSGRADPRPVRGALCPAPVDRKSTRLNSSH